MTQSRPGAFKLEHKPTFNVQVSNLPRHCSVLAVRWRLYYILGRDKHCLPWNWSVSRKRQLQTVHSFRTPFRSDNMLSHLIAQHRPQWEEYQQLDDSKKLSFFDRGVVFVSKMNEHFGSVDHSAYKMHAAIITVVIYHCYAHDNRSVYYCDEASRSDISFNIVKSKSEHKSTLTIENSLHFEMVVGNVAIGMPFKQISQSFQVKVNNLSALIGVWEGNIRINVQCTTPIKIQLVFWKHQWIHFKKIGLG